MATMHLSRLPHLLRPTYITASCYWPDLSPRPRKPTRRLDTRTIDFSRAKRGTVVHGSTDASSKGIGIVIDNKWQRWHFNQESDLLPRSPATNEIDPNWAELFAVYVFLKVHAGIGFEASRVVLRSDSMTVVRTFERHADIHPSLWGIPMKKREQYRRKPYRALLRKIGLLMAKYRLDVAVEWVPANANLADGPSRGKDLLEATRLGYGANVTDDLVGVLVRV